MCRSIFIIVLVDSSNTSDNDIRGHRIVDNSRANFVAVRVKRQSTLLCDLLSGYQGRFVYFASPIFNNNKKKLYVLVKLLLDMLTLVNVVDSFLKKKTNRMISFDFFISSWSMLEFALALY